MTYAVISIGNKQYRVREGEYLLVDRVPYDEGKTFTPELVMVGGDGDPKLGDELDNRRVTAKVAAHVLGKKVVIGKHRRRTGYKRRNGFRARLSRIEIEAIGTTRSSRSSTGAKKESAAKKPAAKKSGKTTSTAKKGPARKSAPRTKKSEE